MMLVQTHNQEGFLRCAVRAAARAESRSSVAASGRVEYYPFCGLYDVGVEITSCQKWPPAPSSFPSRREINQARRWGFARGSLEIQLLIYAIRHQVNYEPALIAHYDVSPAVLIGFSFNQGPRGPRLVHITANFFYQFSTEK
jgi:hypothetical protein